MRCAWLVVGALVFAGCGREEESSLDTSLSEVVGGRTETGYGAVGYMRVGTTTSAMRGPFCGATLISPRLAVTAAHCTGGVTSNYYGIGFDSVGSPDTHIAAHVFEHPDYDPNASPRYRHDLAVLVFAQPIAGRVPMRVAAATVGDTARYVGYGRTTVGDYNETSGYTGERKSATQAIHARNDYNVWTRGGDGGLCWGDSGGPLVSEAGDEIFGVLGDFDGVFYCSVGNSMIFTSLDGERDFLDRVTRCAEEADPADCMRDCQFACEDYNYGDNECRQGWHCDGTCIEYNGCVP